MTVLNAMRSTALGLACLALVAGCTNAPDRQVTAGSIGKSIGKSILSAGKAKPAPSAQKIASDVTKALATTDAPLILVSVPKRHVVTVMQELEQNGGYDTYGTADRRSVVLRGGMMTGTRGLGNDVMSSDVSAVRTLVAARRAGTAERVMRHLDGEELTIARHSTCTVEIGGTAPVKLARRVQSTTKVSETCTGGGTSFTNTYRVANDGRILKSRQWHSPLNGYLVIRSLR